MGHLRTVVGNLLDMRFGKWEVVGPRIGKPYNRGEDTAMRYYWPCRCLCGTCKDVLQDSLVRGASKSCVVCSQTPDITGQAIGHWLVLRKCTSDVSKTDASRMRKCNVFWVCVCTICNTEHEIHGSRLYNHRTSCCQRCSRTRRGKDSPIYKGYGDLPGWYWSRVVRRAKNSGMCVCSIEEAAACFTGRCALSNEPITLSCSQLRYKDLTASLDRIDSSLGYTKDNIQWIHKKYQRFKMDLTESELLLMCKTVAAHLERKGVA